MDRYLKEIVMPKKDLRKGENGRVLVIGGSKLFHAAAFWAACMASKMVDLVHFSSPAMENNELMRIKAKSKFWEGIVVPWETIEHYIEEDDAILIGPGMPRDEGLMKGEKPTKTIVNDLLKKYPQKKWVVDGGALQEVDISLLKKNMIVTPNARELAILREKVGGEGSGELKELSKRLGGVTILSKGEVDQVTDGVIVESVEGGSVGMTKGGTGDILAGIVTAMYAKSPALASAVVASRVNKKAGELLEEKVGTNFNASDLLRVVPGVLGSEIDKSRD
ncbi:MAG: ADP/ATP-dependent (S)-NAD(P)H-hydrate dehydratase [bacterium]